MELWKRRERGLELKLILLIIPSLILNVLFGCYIYIINGRQISSWSSQAAAEAEAMAAITCSGHGQVHLDSVLVNGVPTCECNSCYAGKDCSLLLPDCPADAESGDPLFLEPYWRRNAARSAVLISGWHRMSYYFNGGLKSPELEHHLLLLHDTVRNAVTRDRYILFGSGSTQLTNAAVHALSPSSNSCALVVASSPYYNLYRQQTELFNFRGNTWKGSTSKFINLNASSKNVIEFVTSPNNPDCLRKRSVIVGSSAIHDYAYNWPHYTSIDPSPADEDIMLFSISKVSGHAGSRFGWALVKDWKVYQRMNQYLGMNTLGFSRDTQLRVLKLLKVILSEAGREGDVFRFGYETLKQRWLKLNEVISSSTRFSLQKLSPQYCSYFREVRDPSPGFAWVKCEREEDKDCQAVLMREGGIISRPGNSFEADNRYTRLSLLKTEDDFELLLSRMNALVSKEGDESDLCNEPQLDHPLIVS